MTITQHTLINPPSPNYDSRKGQQVDILLLHYTGMRSGEEALNRLCDPAAKVSAHYLIEEDGRVFQLVEEDNRAWHAGVAYWRGHTDINARSIGIEIVNPGHEFGYRPFPEVQIEALIPLCHAILSRHTIPARNVIGHSDVAPERKQDPGELFPWERLAREGIGIWPDGQMSETKIQNPEALLALYGYTPNAPLHNTITAFQRHFCPHSISGKWDAACEAIICALLDKTHHSI